MGITIHYSIAEDSTVSDMVKKLEAVRQMCLDLPFENVDEVKHIVYTPSDIAFFNSLQEECFCPNNTIENLEKRDQAIIDRGLDLWTLIEISFKFESKRIENNIDVIHWGVWTGKGCEDTTFSFMREQGTDGPFECKSFTKTQFAEELVKCHLLVIKVLDLLQEQGFKAEVNDEGDFWKTRDYKVLGKNINISTSLITSVFGALKQATEGTDAVVESPIKDCKNYMKTE